MSGEIRGNNDTQVFCHNELFRVTMFELLVDFTISFGKRGRNMSLETTASTSNPPFAIRSRCGNGKIKTRWMKRRDRSVAQISLTFTA